MDRGRRKLALTVALVGLLALPSSAGMQPFPVLRGTVGTAQSPDAFVIRLTHEDGDIPVTQLDPGTYTIVVEDFSTMHNFHLRGPGVVRATTVEGVEEVTWTVTFVESVYRFVCDPHAIEMRGSFRVGNPPSAPVRLNASVGPGNAISLRTAAGARVRTLPGGEYRIVVRDRSRRHNFRLVGPGVARATGIRFAGAVTWTVTLRTGAYRYFSAPQARRLRGSFRVT